MAIGLAFVDIVGDTSRTEAQIERDMTVVISEVEGNLDPVEVNAEIDDSQDRRLLSDLNAQIADLQSRAEDLRVNPSIDEFWRADGLRSLNRDIAALQAQADEIRVDVDTDHIAVDLSEAVREAVHIAQAAAPPVEIETRVDNDRVERSFSGIASAALGALGPVQSLGTALVAVGTAAPALAGVAAALASMAPAAALAAPAILGVVSANAAVKIGMLGVEDAVKAAFDTEHPEKFAEALKGLSPNAQAFVKELQGMKPELDGLRKSVQDRLFAGLDGELKNLAASGLPSLQEKLGDTAGALNQMARSAAQTAANLSKSGLLGRALDESNSALLSLAPIPGVVATALTQLAVAAGPAFGRLTDAASSAATGIGERLTKAFESGALQSAIEGAIGQVKILGQVLANVGTVLGNVFKVAQQFSGGSLGGLKALTDELAKFSASKSFQDALTAIFSTAQQVTQTALPLLGQALAAIGPILQALLPGVQALLNVLGPALSQVITALAPVLQALAQALSTIVIAAAPLITLLGTLIAAILPALTPLLQAVTMIFTALTPVIAQIAQVFAAVFVPILNVLIQTVLPPLIQLWTTVVSAILPLFGKLLEALAPALMAMSASFVALATALAPVIQAFAELIGPLLATLTPILIPIIDFVGKLAAVMANTLAQFIMTIVVPALQAITSLLKGDFSGAWQNAKLVIKGYVDFMVQIFVNLPAIITDLIGKLGTALFAATKEAFAKFRDAAVEKIQNDFFPWLNELSPRIAAAVGNLGSTLLSAGRSVIQGLLDGVRSKLGELQSLLSSVTNLIPSWKGPADRDAVLLTPAGQLIMEGLISGIDSRIPALRSQLAGITNMFGTVQTAGPNVTAGGARIGSARQLAHFAGGAGALGARLATGGAGATQVQVFIGDRELTDIVDTRVFAANRAVGAQITAGMRR